MRPIPAGRLVGATLAALLASAAAAQAAAVDVARATPGAPLTLAGRGSPPGAAGADRLTAAGGASLRAVLAPATAAPGTRVTVRGRGFPAHARVTALIGGRFAGRAHTTRRGRFVLRALVPALAPGTYALRLRAHRVRLRVRLRVIARPASHSTPGAGVTGGPAAPPVPSTSAPAPAAPPPASPPGTPPSAPPPPPPPPPPPTAPVTVAAAGDISCDPGDPDFNGGAGVADACQQRATSSLLLTVHANAVFGLGDMQYNEGGLADFDAVYRATWGRVDSIMFPVPGNHDYSTPGAAGFFSYFGPRAGPADRGYYSFDIGAWHVIALNSNCDDVSCAAGSPQETWLRSDLAAHPGGCTLAFFHHPLFSSGHGVGDEPVRPFWDDLYAAGADLVLNGHSHNYERFAPQTPAGAADAARGIREFVAGTGGENLQPFLPGTAANSQRRSSTTFGVLVLTLRAGGYSWQFRPAAGGTFTDSGSGTCH